MYVFPGGGIEHEETNEDAALRELEEESGLRGNIIKSLGIFKVYFFKRFNILTLSHAFIYSIDFRTKTVNIQRKYF